MLVQTPRRTFLLVLALAAGSSGCSQLSQDPAVSAQPAAIFSAQESGDSAASAAGQRAVGQHAVGQRASQQRVAGQPAIRLKPGLWRVEGGVFDGLVDNGNAFICIDAAHEAIINRGPAEFVAGKCKTDAADKDDLYLGSTVCKFDGRTVSTRIRVDDGQIYFRDVIVETGADADGGGDKSNDYAEWKSECGPQQKPGVVYTQAYGETALKPVELPERLRPTIAAK